MWPRGQSGTVQHEPTVWWAWRPLQTTIAGKTWWLGLHNMVCIFCMMTVYLLKGFSFCLLRRQRKPMQKHGSSKSITEDHWRPLPIPSYTIHMSSPLVFFLQAKLPPEPLPQKTGKTKNASAWASSNSPWVIRSKSSPPLHSSLATERSTKHFGAQLLLVATEALQTRGENQLPFTLIGNKFDA